MLANLPCDQAQTILGDANELLLHTTIKSYMIFGLGRRGGGGEGSGRRGEW